MSEELRCWPEWMPKPQQTNYSYDYVDRRTKTDMEVGSVLRVNFDTDESTLNCRLILNRLQSQWFEVFESKLQNHGARWFRMPIQIAGCIVWHTVRFASRPKASIMAPHYTQYDFTLDIWKKIYALCPGVAEFLLCHTQEELISVIEPLRDFWISLKKLQIPYFLIDEYKDLDMSLVTPDQQAISITE